MVESSDYIEADYKVALLIICSKGKPPVPEGELLKNLEYMLEFIDTLDFHHT